LEAITDIHKENKEIYGVRRVYEELIKDGWECSVNRVARLMRKAGLRSKTAKKFKVTTDSDHSHPVAENLLNRNFSIEEPDKAWVGDITYIWTRERWLYLAVLLDLCDRSVVGWSMSDRIDRELVKSALRMAVYKRGVHPGLIHHTDRGSQYACEEYGKMVDGYGMIPSMSRKGNCWDNAVAESFFASLKKELVNHADYRSREEARQDIFWYIESFYNRNRLHSSLGYLTPAAYGDTRIVIAA
jgi:transposase InsO family protein